MYKKDLEDILQYDQLEGCFYWRISRGRVKAGNLAGSDNGSGYKCIRINGKSWRVHVLVWLMETDSLPSSQIDHKDTNRSNNRFENLRLSTQLENTYNRSMMSTNKSGIKGVHWHKASNKWRVVISVNKTKIEIGKFINLKDAKNAIEQARFEYHQEFSRN